MTDILEFYITAIQTVDRRPVSP